MKRKENRLVVADAGWADTIPDWLLKEVKAERMIFGLASIKKKIEEVGDAEACVYLCTLSLRQPMTEQNTRIYLYLCTKLMEKQGKKVPEEIRVRKLNEYDNGQLKELKRDLYKKRGGEIQHPLIEMLKNLQKGGE